MTLALFAAGAAVCTKPTDACDGDWTCNPGRVCVMGICMPAEGARPGGGDGATMNDGAVDIVPAGNGTRVHDAPMTGDRRPDPDCPADAGECAWTPSSLPGVVLWLDSGVGVAIGEQSSVSLWQDQSGHGNDAVQDDGPHRPTFVPAGANGRRPLVWFRPPPEKQWTYLRVQDGPSLHWGLEDIALFVVASSTNGRAIAGVLLRKTSPPPRTEGLHVFAEGGRFGVMLRAGTVPYETIREGLTDGPLFAFNVRRRAKIVLELRVNGEPQGRVTGPELAINLSAVGADIVLGAGADVMPTCCQLYGGIAEVIAVKGPLVEGDVHRLEAYLGAKYGLPVMRQVTRR